MLRSIYPQIEVKPNLQLNFEDDPDFFKDGIFYHTREVMKHEIRNVFILPDGTIYKNLSLLKESLIDEIFLEDHPFYLFFKKLLSGKLKLLNSENQYLSFFDSWSSNHYHFLVDFLPRLLLIKPEELKNLVLILPSTSYFKSNVLSFLKLFHFKVKDVLFIQPHEILFARQLVFLSKAITTGFAHPDLLSHLKGRWNKDSAENLPVLTIKPEKIYITRNNARFRKVLNEEELTRLLEEKYGFVTIDFGAYSVEEQAALASKAKVLVGMHGAGLTNLFFMSKGAHVVEFRRRGMHHNHCYWQLASAVGVNYLTVFGNPDDYNKVLEGNGCNLFVEKNDLIRTLDNILY